MRYKFKKSYIIVITSILLFNIFIPYLNSHSLSFSNKYNILILNSYHKDFNWTEEQTNGYLDYFKSKNHNANFYIEYMDWKRYPSFTMLKDLYSIYKFKYQHTKIDIIYTTDDIAYDFAEKYRKELFNNAPIVFTGLSNNTEDIFNNKGKNYTGIIESSDPTETVKAAMKMIPGFKKIYLLYDNTESGLKIGKESTADIKKLDKNIEIIPMNNYSHKDIIDMSEFMHKDSIFLMTSYLMDKDNIYMDYSDFINQLNSNSSIPIFDIHSFNLNSGIIGGCLINGVVHGKAAAEMSLQILGGKKAGDIPVIRNIKNGYAFDYNQLKRFDISLSALPMGSQIINKPFSFYETYKKLVHVTINIFAFLLMSIILLLLYIKKIKKMQIELSLSNDELSAVYEELTAANETLTDQYNQLFDTQEQLKGYQKRLEYSAYHDSLTGLYNRLYLSEKLGEYLQETSSCTAVVFIDIDNFKVINDTLGHSIGDELIKYAALRFLTIASEDKLLMRLGGDEFIFFLKNVSSKEYISSFAKKLKELFDSPFLLAENLMHISLSVGIALSPHDGSDMHTLLKFADIAMYSAKKNGKNRYCFYGDIIDNDFAGRSKLEYHLKNAMAYNEFLLYYQPITNSDGKVQGYEALARWNSKALGMISPDKFINIAEESELIITLGEWILREACSKLKTLNQCISNDLYVSVNISVKQLLNDDFTDMVASVIDETGIISENLELEITESIIMRSYDIIIQKIKILRETGIKVSIDDFGTGYSSLAYLKSLPVTTLKIDKSFIDDIAPNKTETAIVKSIIDLGHMLNLTITAEGVETLEQLEELKNMKCDKYQGYYFSKPMPYEDIIAGNF